MIGKDEMQSSLLNNITTNKLAASWLMLGVASLGASTLFAILVAFSRSPATSHLLPGSDFFHLALVLHVTLGPLLSFLSFAMTLWNLALPQTVSTQSGSTQTVSTTSRQIWDGMGWAGFTLSVLGAAILILVPVGGAPSTLDEVVLSNYIAVLKTPMFMTGLSIFTAGFGISLIHVLRWLRPGLRTLNNHSISWGLQSAALAGALALASVVWVSIRLPVNLDNFYEMLFWGPGHILQSMHVLLMMVAWMILVESANIPLHSSARMQRFFFFLALIPVISAPIVNLAFQPNSPEFRNAFTELMRWTLWPGITLLAIDIVYSLFHNQQIRKTKWTPSIWGLMLSIILLVIGLAIGASIQSNNAVVPAHYHATTGAITMAYLGLALSLLSSLTRTVSVLRWPVMTYGIGTLLMAGALGWAGFAGLTRKVPGSEKVLEGYSPHLTVIATGGTLVIIGGIGFVIIMLRGWIRTTRQPKWKISIPILGAGIIMSLGMIFTLLPSRSIQAPATSKVDPHIDPEQHMLQQQAAEINLRFEQAVMMLHAKKYEEAIVSLQRLLKLAPSMPEAYVNMGYALLGMKSYKEALKAFEAAIDIRSSQANAYYGMALTLKELKDIEGAIGAMRTYIHLTKTEDPYLKGAHSLVSEWEKDRGRKPGKDLPSVTAEIKK